MLASPLRRDRRHRSFQNYPEFLADDILIQDALDYGRFGDRFRAAAFVFLCNLVEELEGIADALFADINALCTDKARCFTFAFCAKDAVQQLFRGAGWGETHFF